MCTNLRSVSLLSDRMVDERSVPDLPIAVFYRSIPRTVAIVLLWSALTALGGSLVLGCIVMLAASHTSAADGQLAFGLLLCGLVLVLVSGPILLSYLTKVIRAPYGPIIEISRAGLRDRRISPDIIPWSGIEAMWRLPQSRRLLLILDPAVDNSLLRSAHAAWARRRMLKRYLVERLSGEDDPYAVYTYGYGFGDVSISMLGLAGSFDALVRAVEQVRGVIADTGPY
jgi:hypothetical protein